MLVSLMDNGVYPLVILGMNAEEKRAFDENGCTPEFRLDVAASEWMADGNGALDLSQARVVVAHCETEEELKAVLCDVVNKGNRIFNN